MFFRILLIFVLVFILVFCLILYLLVFFFLMIRPPPRSTRTDTLFPDTTLCRSRAHAAGGAGQPVRQRPVLPPHVPRTDPAAAQPVAGLGGDRRRGQRLRADQPPRDRGRRRRDGDAGRRAHGKAEFVGSDPDTDVALMQIHADNLTAIPLADSDALRVGDFVVAVGNPFSVGQTVTSGIVSAVGRSNVPGVGFQNFIQTDASINPGNSGGALVNLAGQLVGINTASFNPRGSMAGNIGLGFAIPSDLAASVMQQLVNGGVVRRGTLGVETQDVDERIARSLGLDSEIGRAHV